MRTNEVQLAKQKRSQEGQNFLLEAEQGGLVLAMEETQNRAETQKQQRALGFLETHKTSPHELVSKLARQA